MPYINSDRRRQLKYGFPHSVPITSGELNYILTNIILDYLEDIQPVDKNTYSDYNEVIGVLECIKQELYRRMIAPYEDKKKEEHGDVFSN